MKCPTCNSTRNKVYETRYSSWGLGGGVPVRRKRRPNLIQTQVPGPRRRALVSDDNPNHFTGGLTTPGGCDPSTSGTRSHNPNLNP